MSKIVLNDVTNLNALSVINDNFDKLEQELQTKVLYRDNPTGEPNTLENDVDANGNSLYNIQDLTITGSFTVNGLNIEEVVADAAADIEANAASALNSATAAAASAASASASASSATASASTATTKASEASSSATSAASSATTATTQAGIATTGAATATTKASEASTSASNAATSASTATTQAGIATTKAGEASTSATNAATSASSASTSATSAANSAAAAATALDSFDDRYLGTKASDPTLDNDGNALLTGALYYNTTTQTMKVYDGANWIAATAAGTASMSVYKYVATAGQTTFSGAAAVGGTMSYTSGNIIVFLNGASLDSTDYTATNGTSVVLSVAASLNDEVVIVAFKSFTVADTYTQSAADAKFVEATGAEAIAGVKTFSDRPVFSNGIDLNVNGQIKFPASQNASSDANTLDDYEEGTWNCTLNFGSGSGEGAGVTYNNRTGNYIKVGRLVTVRVALNVATKGSATGYLSINNLPFPIESISYGDTTGAAIYGGITLAASNYGVTLAGANGGTNITTLSNANSTQTNVTNSNCGTTFYLTGTFTYTTTS